MNLLEAIQYIQANGLVIESSEFNRMDVGRFAKSVLKTADSHERAGRNNVNYDDDRRYKDYQGIKWLNVRKRDDITLTSAIVDGMMDVVLDGLKEHIKQKKDNKKYLILTASEMDDLDLEIKNTENSLAKILDMYKNITDIDTLYEFVDTVLDIEHDDIKSKLEFLNRYKHGTTTVYRGYAFDDKEYKKLVGTTDMRRPSSILQFLNNKTKKFNSFSINPEVARDFSIGDAKTTHSFIIAAEVEPNDINFAFTAYLLGRHNTLSEYELNINNLKDLKNLRIITDIDREINKYEHNMPSVKMLQGLLDSGKKLNEIFDQCRVPLFNKDLYICLYDGYYTLVKDRKVLLPLSKVFFDNISTDILKLYYGKGKIKLFNINKGFISDKIFKNINFDFECKYAVGTVQDGEDYLFNLRTWKQVIKNPLISINIINKFRRFAPDDWFIIQLKQGYTIINSNCKNVFKCINPYFEKINTVLHKFEIHTTSFNGKKKIFICQNGQLVERI